MSAGHEPEVVREQDEESPQVDRLSVQEALL